MGGEGNTWLNLPKYTKEYTDGVKLFVKKAMANFASGNEIKCPCRKCQNRLWWCATDVESHLIWNGPSPQFVQWIYDVTLLEDNIDNMDSEPNTGFGDNLDEMLDVTYGNVGPNADARKFYRLVDDGKQPLYPGCKKFSRLSFLVRIYHWKCLNGVTESAFGEILTLLKEAVPDINVPASFNSAKNIIKDLGLDYKKIHACPNDCMLYWGENRNRVSCKTCGSSRWKGVAQEGDTCDNSKIPAKVMRYFPLTPRLQRMFMCKNFAKQMVWHDVERKKDGKLRHPADGEAWKTMDAKYPTFSSDNRNVRLGLATDGFNPFRKMSATHSTWPIVVVNYNLPPWLNMKPENLILSTIIPGPNDPGNNIDVYMQPLIEELKELWKTGVETYDAATNQSFTLRAGVIWTISDFPGYAMLSGWSTKGKLACPICHYETSSMYLKHSRKVCYMNHRKFLEPNHKWRGDKRRFNGEIEAGTAAPMLSGRQIYEILDGFENSFGLGAKRRVSCDVNPWNKKSILFDLPYWKDNLTRHNLDVMHIEKNICDSVLGTLLNIGGKTKDHLAARLDLQELGNRKALHPTTSADGKHLEIRAANFDMTNKEKDIFCSVLQNAKFPYGFASNISKCVQDRKVTGYKSHDAHVIMQYLLQFAVKGTLKPEVAVPLIRLGEFLRGICSKVIELDEIKKLQQEIIEVLCQLENIFTNSFFDIMVHLPVHLCKEIEYGGPVHQRWMYSIERYLGVLKKYVRNKSKPEGSIAEGYLADECLTFCSRFLNDGDSKSSNDSPTSDVETCGYPIGLGKNKTGKDINLAEDTWIIAHRYILFNYNDKEVEDLIEKHHKLVDGNIDNNAKSKRYKRERAHTDEVCEWFKDEIRKKVTVSRELACLAKGPRRTAKRFSGYVVNGYRFHTKQRDRKCTTQNSGVFLKALTTSFASSKDSNPSVGEVSYYGAIEEILEVDYWGAFRIVLFRCIWYKEEKDTFGFTRVNFNRVCQKNDTFVLATQVQQVFYIEDPIDKNYNYPIKRLSAEFHDTQDEHNAVEDDINGQFSNDTIYRSVIEQDHETSWFREDVPATQIPNPSYQLNQTDLQ